MASELVATKMEIKKVIINRFWAISQLVAQFNFAKNG
jgi:hypothetical protein